MILHIMRNQGLSQMELSEMSGISSQTLSHVIRGHSPVTLKSAVAI